MNVKSYLPQNEAKLSQWSSSFKNMFAEQASALGFSEEDVEAVTSSCKGIITAIEEIQSAEEGYKQKSSAEKKILADNTAAIREIVRRIKISPAYTGDIGKLLGITGETRTIDSATAVPAVTMVRAAAGYDFKFSLLGYFDAVAVFRRTPGEQNFTRVVVDMKSVNVPAEGGAEYCFQYLKDDILVGSPMYWLVPTRILLRLSCKM
jgi:hypothetical protein